MAQITRIDYFKKNRAKIDKLLNIKSRLQHVLDDTKMKSYKKSAGYKAVFYLKKNNKPVHKYLVGDRNFYDQSCKEAPLCVYSFALAIKMQWLDICSDNMPLTVWGRGGHYTIRIEQKGSSIVIRYKDMYNNVVLGLDAIEDLKKYFLIITKLNRMKNLKSYNYINIMDAAKRASKNLTLFK